MEVNCLTQINRVAFKRFRLNSLVCWAALFSSFLEFENAVNTETTTHCFMKVNNFILRYYSMTVLLCNSSVKNDMVMKLSRSVFHYICGRFSYALGASAEIANAFFCGTFNIFAYKPICIFARKSIFH